MKKDVFRRISTGRVLAVKAQRYVVFHPRTEIHRSLSWRWDMSFFIRAPRNVVHHPRAEIRSSSSQPSIYYYLKYTKLWKTVANSFAHHFFKFNLLLQKITVISILYLSKLLIKALQVFTEWWSDICMRLCFYHFLSIKKFYFLNAYQVIV